MLVSATLDPRELAPEHFSRDGYKSQVKQLFRGIQANGLLISDPDGFLKSGINTAIEKLPTSCSEEVSIRWVEFLKGKRKRVVSCRPQASGGAQTTDLDATLRHLSSCYNLDGIFTSAPDVPNGISLSEYEDSPFEKLRQELSVGTEPLDRLPRETVDDYFIRAVRFAKWIRFYDKQLGRSESIGGFRRGIEYVLQLWRKHGHFASDSGNVISIYTVEKERMNAASSAHVRARYLEVNVKAKQKLEKELLAPLRSKFPWQIEMFIKADTDHITHARHIEAQAAIIRSDLGFDLFNEQGYFKRNQLSVDNKFAEHLREYRELPNAVFS